MFGVLTNESGLDLVKNQVLSSGIFETPEEQFKFESEWQRFREEVSSFQEKDRKVNFIAAERILEMRNSHYLQLIKEVHTHPSYNEMIGKEQAGCGQIEDGTYNFAHKSLKEYILLQD